MGFKGLLLMGILALSAQGALADEGQCPVQCEQENGVSVCKDCEGKTVDPLKDAVEKGEIILE